MKREIEKVQEAASRIPPRSHLSLEPPLRSMGVVQAVKAICTLMGNIETIEIAEAIEAFVSICHHHTPQLSVNIFLNYNINILYIIIKYLDKFSCVGSAKMY